MALARQSLTNLLKRFEARTLLLIAAIVGAAWGFLALAEEVGEGDTEAVDRHLLLMLRSPGDPTDPLGSRKVEESLRDLTALGGFTVLTMITVVGVLAFLFHRKRLHALVMLGTILAAQVSSQQLKLFYGRPRPDLVPHGSYVYSGSFPSGHSAMSAVTFLTLAMLISTLETRRETKALVYVLAVISVVAIGVSRVYLGVHWPSDVLAGWTLGAAWALVGWVVLNGLGGRARPISN